jgi:S1-C subfamily serine protease
MPRSPALPRAFLAGVLCATLALGGAGVLAFLAPTTVERVVESLTAGSALAQVQDSGEMDIGLGREASNDDVNVATSQLLPEERNTISIFQRSSPSVVFINTQALQRNPFTFDVSLVPQGSGSGFVWDETGIIVTNNHVIEGARQIEIVLGDKTILRARVVGADPSVDIAVLKVEPPAGRRLVPLPLADSTRLIVGQKVLAIGNPFGLDRTLTTGVVSALGREIDAPNKRKIRDVIQTDAPINPGNSGGPLLDSAGKVIGVNTMIFSPSGASAGIGFAVPVNTVKRVVPEIVRYGKVSRPSLGLGTVNDHIARRNGIKGVIVGEVFPGRAAARAGLKPVRITSRGEVLLGDVIVAMGDLKVETTDDLLNALEQQKPGSRVVLRVQRDSKEVRVPITLEAAR